MIAGTIWTISGVIWLSGVYWQLKARQHVMVAMHMALGAINIAVGVMYIAAA